VHRLAAPAETALAEAARAVLNFLSNVRDVRAFG
jgi:hypothetical protein